MDFWCDPDQHLDSGLDLKVFSMDKHYQIEYGEHGGKNDMPNSIGGGVHSRSALLVLLVNLAVLKYSYWQYVRYFCLFCHTQKVHR